MGANPWHTALIFVALATMAVGVARRRPGWGLPLVLGLALCAGFLTLAMTAKWSIYATRYYVPMLMVWAPLIAHALRAYPRLVARGVAVLLVATCLVPLLDNYQRSLLHPRYHFTSGLEAYFATAATPQEARDFAKPYEDLSRTLAASKCHELGVGNLVVQEYVLWVVLEDEHWRGTIHDVGVQNPTGSLEDQSFRPCAVVYDSRTDVGWPAALENPSVPAEPPRGMTRNDYGPLVLFLDSSTLPRP